MALSKNDIVAWFNSYLRNRMDFLADIATGVPVMEVTKLMMADIISGIDRNRILLNNISGIDQFNYSIQIKDCRNCSGNCATPCSPITVDSGKDIPVSMPNDVLGFHALYVIIENIIRNTAKHSPRLSGNENQSNNKVNFTIEIRNSATDDSFYEVWLSDSYTRNSLHQWRDHEEEEYFTGEKLKHGNQISEIDWLVFQQNRHIDSDVLDQKTITLRHGAWGMIEMKVAAAYLRKISMEYIDDARFKLDNHKQETGNQFFTWWNGTKILNIVKAANKNGSLAYVFHMLKPKEMVVVDEIGTLYDELSKKQDTESKTDQLKEFGIRVLHCSDNRPQEDKFDAQRNYPYPFLFVITPKFREEIYLSSGGLFKGNLPTRILVTHIDDNIPESRWIASVADDKLIEALRNVTVSFKEARVLDDFKRNTVMDLAWQVWLKRKMKSAGIDSLSSVSSIGNTINEYIFDSQPTNDGFLIRLSHHGDDAQTEFGHSKSRKADFFEAYSSNMQPLVGRCNIYDTDLNLNPEFSKTELAKFLDGVLTKIVIVDERIQDAFKEEFKVLRKESSGEFVRKSKLFAAANIFVPEQEKIDLNAPFFQTLSSDKKIETIFFDELATISNLSKIKGIDIIVIHLGIVEKILTAGGERKTKEDVLKFIQTMKQRLEARIIITSGRGKPDNLPDEVPFIAYSNISQYAVETPFKSALNQAIQSARLFAKK